MQTNDDTIKTAQILMLAATGTRLNTLVKAIKKAVDEAGLTEKELAALEQHSKLMGSVGHITDPTSYRETLDVNGFERVQKRIDLVRLAIELTAMEERF